MKLNHRAGFVAHPFAVYIDHLTPDGSEHRPKVVMVHGGQYGGGCYLVTAEGKPSWAYRFAERGCEVLIPDWPGHGRSGALDLKALTGEQVCERLNVRGSHKPLANSHQGCPDARCRFQGIASPHRRACPARRQV
jgi:pimeloyl-ACP methyl ester carboxylesterase